MIIVSPFNAIFLNETKLTSNRRDVTHFVTTKCIWKGKRKGKKRWSFLRLVN